MQADDGDPLEHAQGLIDAGRAPEAVKVLRARLDAGQGGLSTQLLLATALLSAGKLVTAMETARDAVYLHPEAVDAAIVFAKTLLGTHHTQAAIGELQRCLRLDPGAVEARSMLASAWIDAGELERAFAELALLDPQTVPEHAALVARAEAIRDRTRSDSSYIRHLFDEFSVDYDAFMRQRLQYRGPEILLELATLVMPRAAGLAVLDLGCGTGLGGVAFKPMAASIEGIDLSPGMLRHAKTTGVYSRLREADLESFLGEGGADYDLALAVDTLCYFGDLATTFEGVVRRLKPGGFFLFTVEAAEGADFAKSEKRRWHHSETYLRQAAAAAGLEVAGLVVCTPRFERNQPVAGLAVALQKPADR